MEREKEEKDSLASLKGCLDRNDERKTGMRKKKQKKKKGKSSVSKKKK